MSAPIQSLWIGPRLSAMERLCIRSYLANEHEFHLFVYDEVADVPTGTVIHNANEILDRSRIFTYTGNGSFAGFANMFRYKLLLDRGGWWVDLDTVCLRPFDFSDEYVFASEPGAKGEVLTNAILKSQPGAPFLEYVWQVCLEKDPSKLVWGETGPRLVADAVRTLGLERFTKPARTFCPVSYRDWRSLITPDAALEFDAETWAVHLWHEMWRRAEADKDASYAPGCQFERLKSRYPES
jgi:mannosyltransferase OCH1-like enzyme